MSEIPVWRKAVLSVTEAAEYSSLSPQLLRGFVILAKAGRTDFPFFMSGDTIKIPRISFEKWLETMGSEHTKFELRVIRQIAEGLTKEAEPKRGRPRKERLITA